MNHLKNSADNDVNKGVDTVYWADCGYFGQDSRIKISYELLFTNTISWPQVFYFKTALYSPCLNQFGLINMKYDEW